MREMRHTTRNDILDVNKTTESIIGATIEVHLSLPVTYKSKKLNIGYRIDLLVLF